MLKGVRNNCSRKIFYDLTVYVTHSYLRSKGNAITYTDISACISLRYSTNLLNCLMATSNYCALCIATTNPILIMGFNLKVEVYRKGSLKSINSHKNLAAEE